MTISIEAVKVEPLLKSETAKNATDQGLFRRALRRISQRFWKFTERTGEADTSSYNGLL